MCIAGCLGNLIKVPEAKFIKGQRVFTGKWFRVCDRCSLCITEEKYQEITYQANKPDMNL